MGNLHNFILEDHEDDPHLTSIEGYSGIILAYSNTCPGCHEVYPFVREKVRDLDVELRYVNFDTEVELTDKILEVTSVPSFLVIYEGEVVDRIDGYIEPEFATDFIEYSWDAWAGEKE